ncbi:carboxylesterase family protein [Streptomyces mirabilis]|uniref:carboxylesterase/lipase family protein n=1 Tax=Streptomyces mirabilis TaxID=68239 RepID=UPI0021C195CF|nr:carboxylesterase family protein [Streptomyces mirabilis]MCT9111929.1 carboxylesterase family protein [Streptomyces mirabilis]
MNRRAFLNRSLTLTAAAALGSGGAIAYASDERSAGSALKEPVRIDTGLVSGVTAALPSVRVFKGIPYAASTAGEHRWRPPRAATSWTGVRTADTFGDICPQQVMGAGSVSMSEDCLNLNVWTAAARADERRPVLVWIYGGRFVGGYGSDPAFDGAGLADKGLVVVTFNYRSGAFGFLSMPELSAESGHDASGNYGLLDQIAALRWVRRNISAFGGDPNRVTIAGQSAGGASVMHLLYSPLARGLFHGAISESGGARDPGDPEIAALAASYRTLETAESQGVAYAQKLGVSSLSELRALSANKLTASQNGSDTTVSGPVNGNPPLFRPVLDGWVKPWTYAQALAGGHQHDVPVLAGGNKDENGASPQPKVTLAGYTSTAEKEYGALADEFLKLYPATSDTEAGQARNASARDGGRVSADLWAAKWAKTATSPVFTYYWDHAPPTQAGQTSRGACHGSEINYIFDNLYATDLPWTDTDRTIADTLSDYVVNFVTDGDPNGRGLARWAAAHPRSATTMELGDTFGSIALADAAKADFHQRFFASQKPW